MEPGCKEIQWQVKNLYNSRNLRKAKAVYKTNKPFFPKSICSQKIEARKMYLTDLFSVTN